jgi:hypothetical protein
MDRPGRSGPCAAGAAATRHTSASRKESAMRNRERVVIYTVLAVLLAANASLILSSADRPAFAEPLAIPDDLGPADSVALTDTESGDDLVLRAKGGRLSWGEAEHQRTYSVAYVYIGNVLNQLMQAEVFVEEREQLMTDLGEAEDEYRARLEDARQRLQDMDPESEDAQDVFREGEAIWQEYMNWQQEAVAQRGKLDAVQMERAYREMIEAVEVVADRKNIDTVYRFIPTSEAFNAENPEEAMLAIRLRSALRYPDELDITDDVMEELSLEIE